jgi:hypothetical protein
LDYPPRARRKRKGSRDHHHHDYDHYNVMEKGYSDVHALVAFSGEVTDLESAVEKAPEALTRRIG